MSAAAFVETLLLEREFNAPIERVFAAWTQAEVLAQWFGPEGEHQVVMKVVSSVPAKEIRWQCIAGPWMDKGEFIFSITEDGRGVALDFAHHGWQETDDFYKHCNAKWGFFLAVSLKQYLETGKGQPHPNDPDI